MKNQNSRLNHIMAAAREIFLKEVEQRLHQAQETMDKLKTAYCDPEACEHLYLFAHTLRGSGQMVGLSGIAKPAGEMAVALLLVKEHGVDLVPGLRKFLIDKFEEIKEELTRLKTNKSVRGEISNSTGCGNKILIVDDDRMLTELVREHLERVGFTVTVCHDTLSAESQLELGQPDLILLDIVLPGENGIEFCRRIRSDTYRQAVPVIFFTVKSELQDKLLGFATGADDYLAKPFELEELIARINALLARIETFQDWALRDGLTGLFNRRYINKRLNEEIARAERAGSSFSLALIDVDSFKRINDSYGHAIGDKALLHLTEEMWKALRTQDIICRFGGDEFVIIFPETRPSEAQLPLERLRLALSLRALELTDLEVSIPITVSMGLAAYPQDGHTFEELLAAADTAMYWAKKAGGKKLELFKGVKY